jgi:MFS family permease
MKLKYFKMPDLTWIPPGVLAVSIANMLIAISTTMTFSISPFFITSVLGLSMFSMGAMEGFTEGLSQISKLFSGITSDVSKKKKPTLLFGILLATISKPFFILAGGAGSVIASKVLERVSNGVIATPRDAYIADVASKETRGASYGLMMTGKTVGCIVGPLFISALMFVTEDYRTLLWFGFIPCILALFIIFFSMKETSSSLEVSKKAPLQASSQPSKEPRLTFKDVMSLPASYWSLILISSLFMIARFSDGILALRLKELGAPNALCVATIAIFNAVSALCCLPVGRLSDRMDRSLLLFFSFITLVLCNLCFIFATDMWLGLVGVLFWGAQRGTSQILFSAIIADESPRKIIGTAIGLFYIITGIISFAAGLIAGWIANTSLTGAFIFGAVASSLAVLSLVIKNLWEGRSFKLNLKKAEVLENANEPGY